MRIGIGLPNPDPSCPGHLLPRWAMAAEERGFTTLATIDRVAFPNHDSLIALAAAAAADPVVKVGARGAGYGRPRPHDDGATALPG